MDEVLAGLGDMSVAMVQGSDLQWYVARREEIEGWAGSAEMAIEGLLGEERTPVLFPEEALERALGYFGRWPVLPERNRSVRGALEGTVSLEGVLRRFQMR